MTKSNFETCLTGKSEGQRREIIGSDGWPLLVQATFIPADEQNGRASRSQGAHTAGVSGQGVTTLAQNAVDRIQAAEDTLARFNSGSLARKSSMVLICSLSKKDWVTSTPGNTTCVLPS